MPITKGLDLDVSDREDRYSDFGTTNNAKLSVRYQPIDSVTFRGAASTGFRAPTLNQLYSPPFLTASNSRHHGIRESVLLTGQLQCGVDSNCLRLAGTGVERRKQKPEA